MSKSLLKEYIEFALNEEWYWDSDKKTNLEPEKKKNKSFFEKIKGFFSGKSHYEEIANDWIEDRSMYYDIEVSDDLRQQIVDFVEKKHALAMKRTRGNEEKANRLLKKALDIKFEKNFKELSRRLNTLDDEDI